MKQNNLCNWPKKTTINQRVAIATPQDKRTVPLKRWT